MGKQWKQWLTLFFLGSKITADGDCSHEIKRRLLLAFHTSLLASGALGIPRYAVSLPYPPLSSRDIFPRLCVPVSSYGLLIRTPAIGFRAHPNAVTPGPGEVEW